VSSQYGRGGGGAPSVLACDTLLAPPRVIAPPAKPGRTPKNATPLEGRRGIHRAVGGRLLGGPHPMSDPPYAAFWLRCFSSTLSCAAAPACEFPVFFRIGLSAEPRSQCAGSALPGADREGSQRGRSVHCPKLASRQRWANSTRGNSPPPLPY